MTAQMIGALADSAISLAGGIVASLYGYKILGDNTGDRKYDKWYATWGKQLRWLGPTVIFFGVLLGVLKMARLG